MSVDSIISVETPNGFKALYSSLCYFTSLSHDALQYLSDPLNEP